MERVAEQVATVVQTIQTPIEVNRQIQIQVDGADSCRINEGQPVRIDALQTVMQERMRQIKQTDADPAQPTIRISVDDAAPYSNLVQVVEACRVSGFFKFELFVTEQVFPFHLTPLDPKARWDELQLPPLKLRLQASEDGELASLTLNDRRLPHLAQLQLEIIGILGDDRGPGSIQETCEVEFDCDDNLKFSHIADAYLAISKRVTRDGRRVALVEKIWPVTRNGPQDLRQLEELQMLEDFEEFERLQELTPLSDLIESTPVPKQP